MLIIFIRRKTRIYYVIAEKLKKCTKTTQMRVVHVE